MKCKYKKFSNERLCQIINGECQFLLCMYGPECPIYQAFKNWDAYWVEGNPGKVEQSLVEGDAWCDVLDLDFD